MRIWRFYFLHLERHYHGARVWLEVDTMESANPTFYNRRPTVEPAGLEVVALYDDQKIYVHQQADLEVDSASDSQGKEVVMPRVDSPSGRIPAEVGTREKRSYRRWWMVAGIVVTVLIIVLGVTLGLRSANKSPEPTTPPEDAASNEEDSESTMMFPSVASSTLSSTSTTSTTLPTPTSIAPRSPLAVVGVQQDEEYRVIVAYQEAKGALRFSSQGGIEGASQSWGPPQPLRGAYAQSEDAGIALSAVSGDDLASKIEAGYLLYHIGDDSAIHSMQMTDGGEGFVSSGEGGEGSAAMANSNIAAYGPWMVFQTLLGDLKISRISEQSKDYRDYTFPFKPVPGTKLGILFLDVTTTEELQDLRLLVLFQRENKTITAHEYGESWDMSGDRPSYSGAYSKPWRGWYPDALLTADFTAHANRLIEGPDLELPLGASFTAFKAQDGDKTRMFVLYVDENNNIQQLRQDDEGTWEQSSPQVFEAVDEGTNISCISRQFEDLNKEWNEWYTAARHLTRCYFQRGGFLIETQLNVADWVEMGPVPMP
ncbi:hypothetical protein HJFPF1_12075 [Paramyrothecium foliicola]|nr:hypothetical protein HJFPF1_12075 [Paramyrothecium foliicola]